MDQFFETSAPNELKMTLNTIAACCNNEPSSFLALLDYFSRAHEIKIRRSSVVRTSVVSIISEPIAWICVKFWLLLSLGHMPRRF